MFAKPVIVLNIATMLHTCRQTTIHLAKGMFILIAAIV